MFLALLLLAQPPAVTPDPPPLEQRVTDLERRVALLEGKHRPDPMPSVDYDALYAKTLAQVLSGEGPHVYIAVGVPIPSGFERDGLPEFPSGFKGIADGFYFCYRSADGKAYMVPYDRVYEARPTTPEVVVQRPFRLTPTTPVIGAGLRSTLSNGFYRLGSTFMRAPGAIIGGLTNCGPGG